MNVTDEVVFSQPVTEDERAEVAEACVLRLNFEMPMLLDDMSNQVDDAYRALPERLYLLSPDGNVVWRSEPGPFGFDMDSWLAEIEKIRAAIAA
jgi:type I thyroxine 5'-deiodinase